MNKIMVFIGLILVLSLLIVGCNQAPDSVPNKYQKESQNDVLSENDKELVEQDKEKLDSIDDILNKLSSEFELGEKEETYYQIIGAYDGTKIDVDSTKIEVYHYKDSQMDAKNDAKETLDTADNIILDLDNFLILVHSKDNDFANKVKTILS